MPRRKPGSPIRFGGVGRPSKRYAWEKHIDLVAFISVYLDTHKGRGARADAYKAAATKFNRTDIREIRRIWTAYQPFYIESTAAAEFITDELDHRRS